AAPLAALTAARPALAPLPATTRCATGLCGASASRRGRLLGPRRRFLSLLEAEPQAMAVLLERDDLELDRLTLVDHVTRVGDALVRELADVDEALETVAHAHEGTEVDDLGDGAVDDIADLEVGNRGVPRVGLQAADGQADAAALMVDVDDLGLD